MPGIAHGPSPVLLGFGAALMAACPAAPRVEAAWNPGSAPPPPSGGVEELDEARPEDDEAWVAMHGRLAAVGDMHDAVIEGDPARALAAFELLRVETDERRRFADRPEALAALEAFGRQTSSPPTGSFEEIALAVAQSAVGCGACHVSTGARPALSDDAVPRLDGTARSTMDAHRWATSRMWEGLVVPDDDRWRRGTATFIVLPGCDQAAASDDSAAMQPCRRARKLAQIAHITDAPDDRADLYGRLLMTCAACHQAQRTTG